MIKRMIILIIMGLTLSSCDFIHYGKIAIQDNVRRIEMEREKKSVMKKDGPAAIDVDEYKEGVEEAIKDILKRPINKKVEFKGTTLIIPEGTRINSKHGNLVDEKTGYGVFISFSINPHCISKKVNNREYGFFFDKHDVNINKIAKEIMRVNGFEDVCK
ncbi:hypothetical protein [Fusobacterium periodonticum]|uniref:Lipoprotein n=2 Tax=Fusobacterium periodonticum TaxID=860 RepID=A0AAD0HVX0_9FUSO|nr:hypothetical protein [Fusobacterium periodonticum]AVQ25776.1 hypothetical protein C4N17_08920 [Fusobacterium periodonticum]KGE61853.1 hypothetical protein FSAG_002070 [Fusobacterium periodonticum 2_1_31]